VIRLVFIKELRNYLYSLRFSLALVVSLAAFVMAGLAYHQTVEDRLEYRRRGPVELASRLETSAKTLDSVYLLAFPFFPRIQSTLLINAGYEKDLPTIYWARAYQYDGEEYQLQDNLLIPHYLDLDWTFVVGVILSFLALILVYDAFSGEKEDKILGLQLSFPISRLELLWGKYLAGMTVCTVVLVAGLLVSTLTVLIAGDGMLNTDWLIRSAVVSVAFLVYLSLFILLGFIGSAFFTRSSISLVFLLFIWLVLVWTLPRTSSVFGDWLKPFEEYTEEENQTMRDLTKDFREINWLEAVTDKDMNVDRMMLEWEEFSRNHSLNREQRRLARFFTGRRATMASPFSVLQSLTETVSCTGISQLSHLFPQIFNYMSVLRRFYDDKDSSDPDSPHFKSSQLRQIGEQIVKKKQISQRFINLDEVPYFEDQHVSIGRSLADSLSYWLLLVIFNLAFGLFGYLLLYRYDVRAG
jgi:ABC-type transport system involved in multi-copper enzyme maturation permease subunit